MSGWHSECLRFNSPDSSNERWITKEIYSNCFNLTPILSMISKHAGVRPTALYLAVPKRPGKHGIILNLFYFSSVCLLYLLLLLGDKETSQPATMKLDSVWLNDILSLSLGSHGHKPGAVSLLRCQYDRLPYPECGQSSGRLHSGEMVA